MTIQRELKDRLRRLGRWRLYERRLGAGVVLLGTLCCAAITIFAIDSLLRLNATQRLFLLSLSGVGLACVLLRIVPRFLQRESVTELALQVEHHTSSSSTLVTALQFRSGRHNGGSPELVKEAITRGEQTAAIIEWPAPFDWSATVRRASFAIVTVGAAVLLTVA